MERRGLAIRTPDGWLRGHADPVQVASPNAAQAAKTARTVHQNQRHGWQQRLHKDNRPRSGVLAKAIEPEDFEVAIPQTVGLTVVKSEQTLSREPVAMVFSGPAGGR